MTNKTQKYHPRETITKAVEEKLQWLEGNQEAEKDEFDSHQKEVEGIVNPIMMKLYQGKEHFDIDVEGIVNPIMMKLYQGKGLVNLVMMKLYQGKRRL